MTMDIARIIEEEGREAAIRQRRDRAIIAGTEVNGLRIPTDDLTQTRVIGAALAAQMDPAYKLQWKVDGKFIPLDARQVIGIALAVRDHVQKCFDREAELLASDGEIDEGWP